ncbi:MAG: metallophosphoesterase [Candidatus Helarchaeota archaeon]
MCANSIPNEKIERIIDEPEKISELSENEIRNLINKSKNLLKKEPNLIEIKHTGKLLFIGDIHGKFESIIAIHNFMEQDDYDKIVFLGDYVDRGPNQIECINYVLLLKQYLPNKIILLRGNHESVSMNEYYGFYYEVSRRLGEQFFRYYAELYGDFPIAIITDTRIFGVHGGIPNPIIDLQAINKINRNTNDVEFSDPIFMQLLWNDPSNSIADFSPSFRGPSIFLFGHNAFENFIKKNNVKLFIRAHEAFLEGYRFFFNHKLLSIFSAANYRAGNQAMVAEISPNLKIDLIPLE